MPSTRTVRVSVPQDIQESANQVIQAAGLTLDQLVQAFIRSIAQKRSIPAELVRLEPVSLGTVTGGEAAVRYDAAVAAIKARQRGRRAPLATIEEIISARDEGRR